MDGSLSNLLLVGSYKKKNIIFGDYFVRKNAFSFQLVVVLLATILYLGRGVELYSNSLG